jgi:hypothetical protein
MFRVHLFEFLQMFAVVHYVIISCKLFYFHMESMGLNVKVRGTYALASLSFIESEYRRLKHAHVGGE